MAQKTTQYVCSECGYAAPRWLGKCPSCGAFNTMQEEIVAPAPAASSRPSKNAASRSAFALSGGKARPLSEVKYEEFQRVSSGISELDSVLGGGIVHHKVLENCGIDPNEYSGLAFGIGIERIAMLKYGINNINLLYENDLRFLKQFKG